jgi:lipopolysaccharide/colanic/teichoic acid biosynthesis glycosyltransferase
VGYAPINHSSNLKLPKIKRGLLSSVLMVKDYQTLSADAVSRLNLIYAKNHSFLVDLKIIMNHFSKWDN